jgi:hypothetical protein
VQEPISWLVAVSTHRQTVEEYDMYKIFTPKWQCMPIAGSGVQPVGKLKDINDMLASWHFVGFACDAP